MNLKEKVYQELAVLNAKKHDINCTMQDNRERWEKLRSEISKLEYRSYEAGIFDLDMIANQISLLVTDREKKEFVPHTGCLSKMVDGEYTPRCVNYRETLIVVPEGIKRSYTPEDIEHFRESRTGLVLQQAFYRDPKKVEFYSSKSFSDVYQRFFEPWTVDFDQFPYVKDFVRQVINYKLDNGSIDLDGINAIREQNSTPKQYVKTAPHHN